MKKKVYNSAPLPFMGQKRMFVSEFKKALDVFSDKTVFVDLFGGSGLLSHTIKQHRSDATVVYNDFDGYRARIECVARINVLIADIREMVKGAEKEKRVSVDVREKIIKRIEEEERDFGFVDYISLSSSLLFSMNYAVSLEGLKKEALYNNVRKSDFDCTGYLDGVLTRNCDYKALFEEYKNVPNVMFIVDPPYLSTEAGSYKMYWNLADYLDVLRVLDGTAYVYFTSNKSSIIELCDWMDRNKVGCNPFVGAVRVERNMGLTSVARYTDIMLYKTA